MGYVFDTSSFIVLGHYFPERFPSFWEKFDAAVSQGVVASVREVHRELSTHLARPHLADWVKKNRSIFSAPSSEEMAFVGQIFAVAHFQYLVGEKERLKGTPVADPFVVACASVRSACVVTEEAKKENAAKIPNVCEHFGITWTNLEGFMALEGWEF